MVRDTWVRTTGIPNCATCHILCVNQASIVRSVAPGVTFTSVSCWPPTRFTFADNKDNDEDLHLHSDMRAPVP